MDKPCLREVFEISGIGSDQIAHEFLDSILQPISKCSESATVDDLRLALENLLMDLMLEQNPSESQ